MSTRAAGTFTVDSWEEEVVDEWEGAKLSRAHLTKTFQGDIEGTSTTDLLLAVPPVESSAAYVGFERLVGRLHGREGSVVFHHSAIASDDASAAPWRVVPDSGTDDLTGLHGVGKLAVDADGGHSFTLDYELE